MVTGVWPPHERRALPLHALLGENCCTVCKKQSISTTLASLTTSSSLLSLPNFARTSLTFVSTAVAPSVTPTTPPVTVSPTVDLGCYADKKSDRILDDQNTDSNLTPEVSEEKARPWGCELAGSIICHVNSHKGRVPSCLFYFCV